MSDKFKMERFGRYLLLDHLVDGGMAKICRARFLGEQANKIVAIKMIQPQFSNDPAFLQMFKDELKVTFSLSHPNIAQTYDYGEVGSTLYTAMEYVDGQNLKQFLDRLKKKKYVFPVEISTFIISQVSQALFYAHTFTDKLTGQSYKIIHRDISPHNIMITYDGAVKVIDFGIAKAETNSESTQAGTIKGKLSYLAPEYLEGLELDHRYDQFTVGITMWEMLCGRKLFTAANDLAVLKKIQACDIPTPSSINPNVPKELDEIVIKTLQKDRNNRFKDMDALNRALVRFLYSNYPEFNATDLSYFAKELFKDHIKIDREKLKEFGRMDIAVYLEEYRKSQSGAAGDQVDPSTVEALIVSDVETRVELEIDLDEDEQPLTATLDGQNVLDKPVAKSHERKQTATVHRSMHGRKISPASDMQDYTGTIVSDKKGKKKKSSPVLVASLLLILSGIMVYDSFDLKEFFQGSQQSRNPASTSDSTPTSQAYAVIYFERYEPDMSISINGKKFNYSPLGVKVPVGRDLNITVANSDGSHSVKKKFDKPAQTFNMVIPKLSRSPRGLLSSSKKFPQGTKLIYYVKGQRHEVSLPLDRHPMPPGSYKAILVHPTQRDKKANVTIDIEENKEYILGE